MQTRLAKVLRLPLPEINYRSGITRQPRLGAEQFFYLMIILSALLHCGLLFSMLGSYHRPEMSVIELDLAEIAKPEGRIIPRPHFRPKLPPMPREIERQQVVTREVRTMKIPVLLPEKLPPLEDLVSDPDIPAIPASPAPALADFQPPGAGTGAATQYGSKKEYFDMVRMRIEANKKYPLQAKALEQEGRVTVSFVITSGGNLLELQIVKSSGNKKLDKAALAAVQKSMPFPVPPDAYFAGPVPLQLTINFQLL